MNRPTHHNTFEIEAEEELIEVDENCADDHDDYIDIVINADPPLIPEIGCEVTVGECPRYILVCI